MYSIERDFFILISELTKRNRCKWSDYLFAKTIDVSALIVGSPNGSTEARESSLHFHHCKTPCVPLSNMFKKEKIYLEGQEVAFIRKGDVYSSSAWKIAVQMSLKSWA